jgi:TonB family protein
MIKHFLLGFCLLFCLSQTQAQTVNEDDRNDFIAQFNAFAKTQRYVQQPAKFKTGPGDLYDYLQSQIVYPEQAKKEQLSALVFVSFVIDWKTGLPQKVKITQSSNKLFNTETLRLIKTMPAWEPAKKDGYAVGMLVTIPVYFHLN